MIPSATKATKTSAITSHSAPLPVDAAASPASFRARIRRGSFQQSTNGYCPGYVQCNLVVLHQKDAFDFLLFCQRNQQACPLIEVLDVGCFQPSHCILPSSSGAADLRTDLPLYRIYRNGRHVLTTQDVTDYWPEDSVAFLIGCSFSADEALIKSGKPLRSIENRSNVPMYNTNISCQSAGKFHGNMVVSMKPIPGRLVAKEVLVTSQFPHAHGAPVCIGCPQSIGIKDISIPDYGNPVPLQKDEVPVFHACGVTPQYILCQSGVEFAITHEPGCMFVTDLTTTE